MAEDESVSHTITVRGDFDIHAFLEEVRASSGFSESERGWELQMSYSAGPPADAVMHFTILDPSIDLSAAQALVDAHMSDASIAARAEKKRLAELRLPQCAKCGSRQWDDGFAHDGDRAVSFTIFAAILMLLGVGLQLAGSAGAWVAYGTALFVLSQAALKWASYAPRRCGKCGHIAYDWFGKPHRKG